jgi:hypothetical protein
MAAFTPVRAMCSAAASVRRPIPAWLLAMLSFLVSGCAVSFVSSYDPLTDAAVQKSAEQAETIITDVLLNGTTWKPHRDHWKELHAGLAVLKLRTAQDGARNKAEQGLVIRLQEAARLLEETHREDGPFLEEEAAGVRSLLRSLIHHETSKKQSTALANSGRAS